jgi:hypothetical protein
MTQARKRERTMTKTANELQRLLSQLKTLQNGPQDEGIQIQTHELIKKITKLE